MAFLKRHGTMLAVLMNATAITKTRHLLLSFEKTQAFRFSTKGRCILEVSQQLSRSISHDLAICLWRCGGTYFSISISNYLSLLDYHNSIIRYKFLRTTTGDSCRSLLLWLSLPSAFAKQINQPH